MDKKDEELNPRIAISFKEYQRLKTLAAECLTIRRNQSHPDPRPKIVENLHESEGKGSNSDLKLPVALPGARVDRPVAILDPKEIPETQTNNFDDQISTTEPTQVPAHKKLKFSLSKEESLQPWWYLGDLV